MIGAASATDTNGTVIALEYPDYMQYWNDIGAEYVNTVRYICHGILSVILLLFREAMHVCNFVAIRIYRSIWVRWCLDALFMEFVDELAKTEPAAFDFILLDDQRKENYVDDYEKCVRLMRSGALMIITDVINLFN